MPQRPDRLLRWLADRRERNGLRCRAITWEECVEWGMCDGAIVRNEGGFFAIRGFECRPRTRSAESRDCPLIDQSEVGILGFLGRPARDGAVDLLVQAKTEPGNRYGTQIAPTVQATVSNYTRAHGGRPTPLLSSFLRPDPATVSVDVEQSEQGSIFLRKHNRNVLVLDADAPAEPDVPTLAWFAAADVLAALTVDFAVNTDARSVLCSSDWRHLVPEGPFTRWRGSGYFGELLRRSFTCIDGDGRRPTAGLDGGVCGGGFELQPRPLSDVRGWCRSPGGMESDRDGHFVQLFQTEVDDREVEAWQQPLVGNRAPNLVVLSCQEREGVLRFLVRVTDEPGLRDGTALGPTGQSQGQFFGPTPLDRFATDVGRAVLAVDQSDEGGRFFQTVNRYEVRLLGNDDEPPEDPGSVWLTLGQLSRLAQRPSVLTNELRSALSLLLSLA